MLFLSGGIMQYTSVDGFPGITVSQTYTSNDDSVFAINLESLNITTVTYVNLTLVNESLK